MYVQIRLYVSHDLDLLAYSTLPYIKLDDLIHSCVCSYVRGQPLVLPLPSSVDMNFDIVDQRICVTFDEEQDADVISWLKDARYGQLNSLLKMITRSYFPQELIGNIFTVAGGQIQEAVQTRQPKKRKAKPKTVNKTNKNGITATPASSVTIKNSNQTYNNNSVHPALTSVPQPTQKIAEPIYKESESDTDTSSGGGLFDMFEDLNSQI